ncbi:MAG: cyclic nucleotide-binding domain-containing protein [Myxococcota bacterium]
MNEWLWRGPLHDVRVEERSRFMFFAGLAALIGIAQTLGLTGAEALFMSEYGTRLLAATIIGSSVATIAASFSYAARVGNARNDTLFIQMLIGAGTLLVLATVGLVYGFPWISIFLMCFFFVTQAIFFNHWSTFLVDYFDTVACKRLFPLFTVGWSLGGVLGGVLAIVISNMIDPTAVIAGWALLLLVAATLLRVCRRNLRSWGPLAIEEADETSVEGVRGAIRYVRSSALGMALVVSAVGMVLAVVVARYMWLDAFARRFPDPEKLASFIGFFLTATNLVEIPILLVVVPWLISRVGVPTANLVHPVLTILSFGGLAVQSNVYTGAVARMNGEMLENSLAQPIRVLLCNAIPLRFRGRVKAFLELNIFYGAMSIGGVVLALIAAPDPHSLAIAGASAGAIYLVANVLVRREYLRTLIERLRTGRLDLSDLGEEIGNFEAARLADLWEQLLHDEGELPSPSLLNLIPNLASRGIIEPLRRAATNPKADIRLSCLSELARVRAPGVELTLAEALDDPDPRVRSAAIRGLLALGDDALSTDSNRRLMNDPDPLIRAEAALRAGSLEIIEEMIATDEVAACVAALTTAPESMIGAVMLRVRDEEPAIRAAAVEFVARSGSGQLSIEDAREALENVDPRVRRAAVLLLASLGSRDAIESIASAIRDPSAKVQSVAEATLSSLGDAGIDAVDRYLSDESEHAAEAALRVVARSGSERVQEILQRELRNRVRALWYWVIAYQRVPIDESVGSRLLHAAYSDAIGRSRRICFGILAQLESPGIVQNVEKTLRFGSLRSRGDALEVMSHLGDRVSAQHLVTLHEPGPLTERIEIVTRSINVPSDPQELIEASLTSGGVWIHRGAAVCQAREDEPHPEEENMERLLALKQISLFNGLSLDQLEAVHQIAHEVEYLEGELIMREGEQDDQLYLLLEGRVCVYKDYGSANQTVLNELEAVTYFGEMAVLDGGPRSASIVASRHSRLLSLDGASLRELVLQMPEISFEIFRVLATRVRVAENRMSA